MKRRLDFPQIRAALLDNLFLDNATPTGAYDPPQESHGETTLLELTHTESGDSFTIHFSDPEFIVRRNGEEGGRLETVMGVVSYLHRNVG